MHSQRKAILLTIFGLLVVLAILRIVWPDGLITLNFKDAPLAKVIASIERQGHVRVATNVPPETLVTVQLTRVPLMEALETLSVRVQGELRAVVVGAPTKTQVASAVEELKSGKPSDQWTINWFPSMGMLAGTTPADPRLLQVNPEVGDKNDLHSALQQVSMKSGIMTAVPQGWNPDVKMPASSSKASDMAKQIIRSSGGYSEESFLIIAREARNGPPGPDRPGQQAGGPEGDRPGQPGGGGPPRFLREGMNPAWLAQRAEAAIAQLPAAERAAAKADFDIMRKFWEEVRALPEEERRAKMEEFFNRPEVQEKMEERQAANDARRTPAQRQQRMKNYVQRKEQMKATSQNK